MKISNQKCDISIHSKICRLCLAKDADDYGSIYDEYKEVAIFRIIIDCLGIKVRKNDSLTHSICRKCCDELVNIYHIRKKCIESDRILRSLRKENQPKTRENLLDSIQRRKDLCTSQDHSYNLDDVEFLLSEEHQTHDDVYGMQLLEGSFELPEGFKEKIDGNDDDTALSDIVEYSNMEIAITAPATDSALEPHCHELLEDTQSRSICCGCPSLQFDSLEQLLSHRDEQHGKYRILDNSIRPYECDTCYRRFLNAKLLHEHKERPYRKRPHVCKSCGLGYFTSCALRRHEKVCSIVGKNFSCEECGKRFRQHTTLKSHQKLHVMEKALACPICGKMFKKKFEISIHMVTHTSEQPYPCDNCPARFKRKQALKNHLRHHANARPHKCDMCDEWFNSFAARKFHRQTVHEGLDPFRCEECGGSYGRRTRLIQHMKKVHGTDLSKVEPDI